MSASPASPPITPPATRPAWCAGSVGAAVALGVAKVREAVAVRAGGDVVCVCRAVVLLLWWEKVPFFRGLVIRPEGRREMVLIVLGTVLLCGRVEVTVAAYCVIVTVMVMQASIEEAAEGVLAPALKCRGRKETCMVFAGSGFGKGWRERKGLVL
jgi:hypothetical protein